MYSTQYIYPDAGDRYGDWEIICGPEFPKGSKVRHYGVMCVCGNTSLLPLGVLVSGKSKRCHSCAVKNLQPKVSSQDYTIRYVLGDYKKSARRRGLEFALSVDFVSDNIFRPCVYCGRLPSNTPTDRAVNREPAKYNGLDRIDNSVGYIESNCRTCCWLCNRAKQAMTSDEWNLWVKGLVNNYGSWD